MTRRFEPYGYMSSNLPGIFLSQQNTSWPAWGGGVSTSPSEVKRAPPGVRQFQLRWRSQICKANGSPSRTPRAPAHGGLDDQAVPTMSVLQRGIRGIAK